jgi:hypothetical protein
LLQRLTLCVVVQSSSIGSISNVLERLAIAASLCC